VTILCGRVLNLIDHRSAVLLVYVASVIKKLYYRRRELSGVLKHFAQGLCRRQLHGGIKVAVGEIRLIGLEIDLHYLLEREVVGHRVVSFRPADALKGHVPSAEESDGSVAASGDHREITQDAVVLDELEDALDPAEAIRRSEIGQRAHLLRSDLPVRHRRIAVGDDVRHREAVP
jgi:hypothetical protein